MFIILVEMILNEFLSWQLIHWVNVLLSFFLSKLFSLYILLDFFNMLNQTINIKEY